ncbi:hypothetical protein D3C72_1738910 [compost metagenome]
MPPPMVSFSPEKSMLWNSPLLTRALNRVLTPVMQVKGYFLISLTKPGMSRGLLMSRLLPPRRMNSRQFTVSANTW